MQRQILLIAGGREIEEEVYRQFGFGYWTSAFDVMFEKYGWLSVDRAGHEALLQPAAIASYDVVFIGWMPARFWTQEALATVQEFDGLLVLEGPLPAALTELAGLRLTDDRSHEVPAEGLDLIVVEAAAKDRVGRRFGNLLDDGAVLANLGGGLTQRQIRFMPSQALCPSSPEVEAAVRVAGNIVIPALSRLSRDGQFFPQAPNNALAAIAAAHYRRIAGLAPLHGTCGPAFQDWLAAGDTTGKSPEVRAAAGVALEIEETGTASAASWHALADGLAPSGSLLSEDRRLDPRIGLTPQLAWCAARWIAALPGSDSQQLRGQLNQIVDGIWADRANRLEGWGTWKVLAFAGAALVLKRSWARLLLDECLTACIDRERWRWRNGNLTGGALQAGETVSNAPIVALVLLDLIEMTGNHLESITLPANTASDSIGGQLRDNWLRPPLIRQACEATDGEVIASTRSGEPCIARRGRVIATTFPLLSSIVHAHTLPALDQHFVDRRTVPALALADLLFDRVTALAGHHDRPLVRVSPWPNAANFALTIRHDYDRPPDDEAMARLLAWESANGLGVSWYWIHDRTDPERMVQVHAQGQENALHAVSHASKRDEIAALTAPLNGVIEGETWHGSASEYWNGSPSCQAAMDAGLRYTEFLPPVIDFPYAGFPVLRDGGQIETLRGLTGLTFTCTVDADEGDQLAVVRKNEALKTPEAIAAWAHSGFYVNILNHPDINFDRLVTAVKALPQRGRADMTAAAVADWWDRSHRQETLSIEVERMAAHSCDIIVRTEKAVRGLALAISGIQRAGAGQQTSIKPEGAAKMVMHRDGDLIICVDIAANSPLRLNLAWQSDSE